MPTDPRTSGPTDPADCRCGDDWDLHNDDGCTVEACGCKEATIGADEFRRLRNDGAL